ncbi:MAG: F0F1 ATP synthase subunit delta [Verrucomicrobia bacterium]|nr:F0F1 ATP synthase subunit delta [Verrucomicrobiota bacterium]
MKISKKAKREAKQLYRSCVEAGLLDETRVRSAVRQGIAAQPRGYLAMLSHFQRLVKLELQRRQARVESPVPLPGDLQSDIQGNLTRLYGGGLSFSFVQNAALLGGLRVQVGSDVFDGSVQSRLAALQESF